MAQKTDLGVQPAPQPSVSTSIMPEDRAESEAASTQRHDPGANGLKTVHILKEWPIITATVKKAEELYGSLKTSNRIFSWSFNLAERSVCALRERSTKVLSTFYPAIRIADLAASELAEEMQKRLPVVRQPPTKVSEAVKVAFSDLISPVVDKIEFMVNNGKTRTRNATRSVLQMYRKLVVTLDKWMEEMEKYVEDLKSKGVQGKDERDSKS
ncbi:lipid storage droplets surface-binding protein 2-like [Schistocerca nitens]|uniref:lipid storage droplets surface-binding protein 2-like n=1 Tax=Schistocerca nitens TaxID=7011 RepID=UPI002119347A|nr:lipid storage droplets surface-binding protein 2-like [Schistocerca nitens]XP_049800550.1 lipid storage droplets surface-binding protein 2-like [Schistocerca nitens]